MGLGIFADDYAVDAGHVGDGDTRRLANLEIFDHRTIDADSAMGQDHQGDENVLGQAAAFVHQGGRRRLGYHLEAVSLHQKHVACASLPGAKSIDGAQHRNVVQIRPADEEMDQLAKRYVHAVLPPSRPAHRSAIPGNQRYVLVPRVQIDHAVAHVPERSILE